MLTYSFIHGYIPRNMWMLICCLCWHSYWYKFLQNRIAAVEKGAYHHVETAVLGNRWRTILLRAVVDQSPTVVVMATSAIFAGWAKAVVDVEQEARREWGAFERYFTDDDSDHKKDNTNEAITQALDETERERIHRSSLLSKRTSVNDRSEPQEKAPESAVTTETNVFTSAWQSMNRRWTYESVKVESGKDTSTLNDYPIRGRYMDFIDAQLPERPEIADHLYEWQKSLKTLEYQGRRKRMIEEDIQQRVTSSKSWLTRVPSTSNYSLLKFLQAEWWLFVFLRSVASRRNDQKHVPFPDTDAYLPMQPRQSISTPRLERLNLIVERLYSLQLHPHLLTYNLLLSQLNFAVAQPRWQPAIGILQNLIIGLFGSVASNENQWLSVERRLAEKVNKLSTT